MLRIAGLLVVGSLLGGCGSSKDEPAPSCNDLQSMAAAAVSSAAGAVDQCTTKADCRIVNFAFDCVDCVHVVGDDRVQAAIMARAPAIRQICDSFKASGCKLMVSGCPPLPLDAFQCQQNKCVLPP